MYCNFFGLLLLINWWCIMVLPALVLSLYLVCLGQPYSGKGLIIRGSILVRVWLDFQWCVCIRSQFWILEYFVNWSLRNCIQLKMVSTPKAAAVYVLM